MAEDNFSVWLFRPRYWREGDVGRRVSQGHPEPAEAADEAERYLQAQGLPGQSYCEIRFNGDAEPHTVICLMATQPWMKLGIYNTPAAKWPIYYPPEALSSGGEMLAEFPFEEAKDGSKWKEAEGEAAKKQKSEDDGNMRLDEIEDDGKEEAEDEAEEEAPDDDGDDDFGADDDGDDSGADEDDGDDEAEDDEGEDEDDDQGDEDEEDAAPEDDEDDEQEGNEEGENEEKDSGEDDEEEDDLDGKSGDGDEAGESEDDGDNDQEEEAEMPRLNIFAKLRGPHGWRKRAEAEELNERNTFAMKLGIVNDEAEKTSEQEREVFAEIIFVETDDDRTGGLLRMKLPEGVEFSEPTKAGWVTARIPYRSED